MSGLITKNICAINFKNKVMKAVLFILFILNTNLSYASFTGRVYLQETGKNQPGLNITGISNVAVSDGLNVVLTDEDGFFELPGTSNTRFINITVPAGYTTSDRHYIKVDNKISSYDFELNPFPLSAKEDIRFIQITDTETFIDNGWIQPVRDYASNEKASFIVHTGDICYRRAMVFHSKYVNNETMGVPVFYCIGNHDMEEGNYGEELFEELFGPVYYSFQAGNTHFIVTPMLQGTHRPSYSKEDVYRWMKNDLKHVDPSKNVVVFNHFLLTTEDEFIYGINDEEQINLNDHNLKAWIYGHHHANYKKQHGNTGIISVQSSPANKGGINHSPSNFLVYEINQEGEITVVPRYNFLDNHLTVITPNRHNYVIDNAGQLKISVNTYSTRSPTVKVEFKVGEEEKWLQLEQKTDWNWAGTYPAEDLQGAKSHKITFRVFLGNEDSFTSSGYFLFSEKNDKDYSRESGNKTARPPTYGNNEEKALQLAWVSNAGANIWMCSPVYENGNVYIATLDEFSGENNYIAAFDAKSGELDWKYRINSPVKNSISIDNGIVFATDQEGTAYAINGRTGSLVWKRDLGRTSLQGYISGGVIHEGIYYTGYGNYLSALDISDGRVLWKNDSWNGGFGTTANHTVAGNTLVVGANWLALFGHDLKTGKQKWSVGEEGMRSRSASASFVDDTLFVTGSNVLAKMDPESGEFWSIYPTPYSLLVSTTPLVSDTKIVMGTTRDGMVAFDRASMEEIWKVRTGPSLIYTSPYSMPYSNPSMPYSSTVESAPVLVGDLIVFGASDGYLYAVDWNDGTIVSRTDLGSPVLGTVSVIDNQLFVADFAGNLYKFFINSK